MHLIELTDDHLNYYPPGFLEAMGELVVEFGRAEYLVKLTYKDLAGLSFSEGLAAAEGHRQFSQLCDATKKAATEHLVANDDREKLVELLDDMKERSRERNDMVHAMWYRALPDGTMQRSRIELDRKTKKLDWTKSTLAGTQDVKSLAKELRVRWEFLHELRQHIKKG